MSAAVNSEMISSGLNCSRNRISVLVPSYRRPQQLERCLAALVSQERHADQIIIVIHAEDDETRRVVLQRKGRLPIDMVEVAVTGQVWALNAGLAHVRGEIVAITDDDAAPRPQWLKRIEEHFSSDPKIGGVGGRDWVHEDGTIVQGQKTLVGRVLWFGRIVGDHHQGGGAARDVDILKGANCSFRMAAIQNIGFDSRLRGKGAQVHNDMLASLAVRKAGWRLVYDPDVAVDHFPAQRFDNDQRRSFNSTATADRTYNLRLALRMVSPGWKRMAALIWFYLVGTRDEPGLLSFLRMLARREPYAVQRFRSAHGFLFERQQ